MSKEFEDAVLKKLDVLDERTKCTDEIIEGVVLKKLDSLENDIKELASNTNERLGKVEIELKDTGEVIMDIRQRFAKFDFEINRKIDTLCDADTVNQEKHDFFENKIVSLEAKDFNHDIRISNLEDKVLTA